MLVPAPELRGCGAAVCPRRLASPCDHAPLQPGRRLQETWQRVRSVLRSSWGAIARCTRLHHVLKIHELLGEQAVVVRIRGQEYRRVPEHTRQQTKQLVHADRRRRTTGRHVARAAERIYPVDCKTLGAVEWEPLARVRERAEGFNRVGGGQRSQKAEPATHQPLEAFRPLRERPTARLAPPGSVHARTAEQNVRTECLGSRRRRRAFALRQRVVDEMYVDNTKQRRDLLTRS